MKNAPYIEALLNYQQADQDGIQVLAYRQAIHETVDALTALTAERDALLDQVARLKTTVDAMNCTTQIAHSFEDGLDFEQALEQCLDRQVKALLLLKGQTNG